MGMIRRMLNRVLDDRKRRYIDNLVRNGMKLGRNVEIIDTFYFDPSHCYLISIGDDCTICPNVKLIAHDASTKKHLGYTKLGRIAIGRNVFLGDSAVVLPNTTIGENSIIAAGSVVVNDVPADSVAGGNPARVICTVREYLDRMERLRAGRTVYTEEYFIGQLDEQKRQELVDATERALAFIV